MPHEHDVGVDAAGGQCTDFYERKRDQSMARRVRTASARTASASGDGCEFLGEFLVEHAGDEREAFFNFFDRLMRLFRLAHFRVGKAEPDPGRSVARVDRNGFLVGPHGLVVLRLEVVDVAEVVPRDDEVWLQRNRLDRKSVV